VVAPVVVVVVVVAVVAVVVVFVFCCCCFFLFTVCGFGFITFYAKSVSHLFLIMVLISECFGLALVGLFVFLLGCLGLA